MKKTLFFISFLMIICSCFITGNNPTDNFKKQKNSQITFTENKGQVSDQFNQRRQDVLFAGSAGELVYHIRNTGVSYQLNKIDSYKEKIISKTNKPTLLADQQTIYRVDINWLNCNKNFSIEEGEASPGHSNYYLEVCPKGIHNVKTYKDITLKNIYLGTDLHYYEKDGVLKYDYLVAPHANYKQIQMEVKGAEIKLLNNGNLILKTSLGNIEEGAPVVYQNGKKIKASWKIKNNILSFDIPKYDPAFKLIIDPPTRVWGTYIGGLGNESESFCATDKQGDVYITGITSSASGTSIATVGSHQFVYGGNNFDAFLAKYNSAGYRQWATYYGGSGIEFGLFCATDLFGYVYICGNTGSTNGSVIATPGAHQTINGGGNYDAFLAKFSTSTGVRQWGTYYGGADGEYGNACSVSPAGDVFLTGLSCPATNATVIATPGAHQTTFGGNSSDGYLVKFNANGVRQWGTYYGGTGPDKSYACTCDTLGNVFICGETGGSTGTSIATPGSHQPVAGGTNEAFLAKFDPAGNRMWGTFYGGNLNEIALSCAADRFDHVFLLGVTNSASAIATPGSYESTAPANDQRPFLVRFNTNGQRHWGTYYGGPNAGIGNIAVAENCITDGQGSVYFTGRCTSNASAIATLGSHQPTLAAGVDAYLVKFDSLGLRKWGTYYGGSGSDYGNSCAVDTMRNIYLSGYSSTSTGVAISTTLTHQSYQGGQESYLAKFNECGLLTTGLVTKNVTCFGTANGSATVIPGGSSGYSYTWSPGGANTPTVAGLSPGVYSVTVTNSCNISSSATLQINQPPVLSLLASSNNTAVCPGKSATLTALGSGGSAPLTYSWSNNALTNTTVITPTLAVIYSVQVTDANLCTNSATVSVGSYSIPIISVNSGSICTGSSFNLVPTGAISFTYSPLGSAIVSPTMTTTYSVSGTSSNGCISSFPAIGTVSVYSKPILSLNAPSGVCPGNSATIICNGASSYTWNSSTVSSSLVITPVSSSVYSVTGENIFGCTNTLTNTLFVFSLPNIVVSGTNQICLGSQVLLNATGANNYTWNTNATTSGLLVQPLTTSSYSVVGIDANGCSNIATKTLTVLSLPTILANASQTLICSGSSVSVNGSGGIAYNWSGGVFNNVVFFPTQTGNYTVTGSDANGCNNVSNITVSVNPGPTINVVSSDSVICAGESGLLTVSGTNQYLWSTGSTNTSITVTPIITTAYTVTGTNGFGCSTTTIFTQIVDPCTGLKSISKEPDFQIFPNPFNNKIRIISNESKNRVQIFSALGSLIYDSIIENEKTEIDLSIQSAGVYFIKIGFVSKKIIKE